MRGPLRVDAATEGQELHWTQRPALRLIGPPLAPSASAPSAQSCPFRPSVSMSSGVTGEDLLRRLVDRIEVRRPVDALAIPPLLEHLRRERGSRCRS